MSTVLENVPQVVNLQPVGLPTLTWARAGKMTRNLVRFGTDTEYFFRKGEEVVPADNYLPPQMHAHVVHHLDWHTTEEDPPSAVYYDGIQGEFSITPSTCRAYVCDGVQHVLKHLVAYTREQGLTLDLSATVPITEDTLKAARDKRMAGFGCAPSNLRRARGRKVLVNVDGNTHFQRYAGLHLHLGNYGWTSSLETAEGKLDLVKWLDLFVGLFGVFYENDLDRERRKIYGRAGEYREKPYGLEYRTPSPRLLRHPALFNQAMSLARIALNVAADEDLQRYFELPEEEVTAAIDNVDHAHARDLYGRIRNNLGVLGDYHESDLGVQALHFLDFLFEVGVDNVFADDLTQAWQFDEGEPHHGDRTPTFHEVAHWLNEGKSVLGVSNAVGDEFRKYVAAAA